jgi:hypothetical protein
MAVTISIGWFSWSSQIVLCLVTGRTRRKATKMKIASGKTTMTLAMESTRSARSKWCFMMGRNSRG